MKSIQFHYTEEPAFEAIKDGELIFACDNHYVDEEKKINKMLKKYFNSTNIKIEKLLQKENNIYEGIYANKKVKFFIDIDYKIEDEDKYNVIFDTADELLESSMNDLTKFFNEKHITLSKPIILRATTNEKFSFHLIYTDLVFDNVTSIKNIMTEFTKFTNELYEKIIDTSVYRKGYFRCINQAKLNKNNALKCEDKINVLDTLIMNVDEKITPITYALEEQKKKDIKIKNIKPTDLLQVELQKDKIKLTDEQIQKLVLMVDKKRADDYTTWVEMLFCLKCENNDDNLKHFDTFSQRSKNYNANSVKAYWLQYDASKTFNKLNYGSLLYWAKIDNPIDYNLFKKEYFSYLNIKDEDEIIIKDTLEIEQEYLLMNKKLADCDVSNYIKTFIKDETKTLLIKSPYNTGKTTFLKTICEKYERILFISYRITLSSNLYGNFKDLGFELYNKNIFADKLICQVDSLPKINNILFDLIIIDESESVLNHFSAGSLKDSYGIFQLFCAMCINSKKLICLDGDLANRTKRIFNCFGNAKYINNKIKKDLRVFSFTPDQTKFSESIQKKIESGKNICIVSMSEQQANIYYDKYKKEYKVLKYTSKTSDCDKKLLAEVNDVWIKYQIVIYSPSIEAGVDFNVPHFDNIFIIMCSNSTSPRGLNQMVNRIRQLKDKQILCFTHNLTITENLKLYFYNFDEIKIFYNSIVEQKNNYVLEDNNIFKSNNDDHYEIYDLLMMYNKQELLNKGVNCFLPYFIKINKNKGHKIQEEKEKQKRVIEKNENIVKNNIIEAKTITQEEYEILTKKQVEQELNEDEKYKMTKFIYENMFNLKFDNKETMDKYYNRFNIIKNAKNLLKKEDMKNNKTEMINIEMYNKIITVEKVLSKLNINLEILRKNKITITKDELIANIKDINKILQDDKIMMNLNKNINIKTSQALLGTLRSILSNYGIEINTIPNTYYDKEKEKKCKYYVYDFMFDEEVLNKIKILEP